MKGCIEMRNTLKKIGKEERHTFIGTFVKTGQKSGYKVPVETIMLKNIKTPDGKMLTDHLWFTFTKGFKDVNLQEGDIVQFDARVAEYERGYFGRREEVYVPWSIDYKLSFPTKIKVIYRKSR